MRGLYRNRKPRHWAIVVGTSVLLVVTREFFPRGFLWLTNVLILAFAAFITFLILSGTRKLLWGTAALAMGVGVHAWQVSAAIRAGRCTGEGESLLQRLHAWDACLDYLTTARLGCLS